MSGNRIVSNGQSFTPEGVTVFGLAYPDWQSRVSSDQQQIDATAQAWHGNTVRIQVAPSDLFDQQPYDAAYLSAIDQEIQTAHRDRLIVILSAQYERTAPTPFPNSSTEQFWKLIAPRYAHDSGVWFDLFNEPQLAADRAGGTSQLWTVWRNGGLGYVGMQQLVDTIRVSASNIVLAEGVDKAESLSGLPGNELSGGGIAYAVHPYFRAQWSSPASWDQNWGNLASNVPIVADEWGEYQSAHQSCVADAPSLVPQFLSYLTSHHIGLVAWALLPGVLVTADPFSQPTSFAPGTTFSCTGTKVRHRRSAAASSDPAAAGTTGSGQGAGATIMAYFAAQSAPAPVL